MGITSVQSGIGSTAGNFFESVKNTVIWSGHQISKGISKLVELLKAVWNTAFPYIKDFTIRTGQFLRTYTGMGLFLGTVSLGMGLCANRVKDNKCFSVGLQISSFVLGIASGALLGYGFAAHCTRLF